MNALTRRRALSLAAGFGLAVPFAGPAVAAGTGGRNLVVVLCRGGMDGLSVAPPVGDPDYAGLRGRIAVEGALPLDGTFGLHPELTATHALAKAGQARLIPAVASPDRGRSHFEAQDVLETGAAALYGAQSGWLNRAVAALAGRDPVAALSVGATAPLILRGGAPAASWSPGRAVDGQARLPTLLQDLYAGDPVLGRALASGLATEAMAQAAMASLAEEPSMTSMGAAPPANAQALLRQGRAAAKGLGQTVAGFMREAEGPQIVALSAEGFDTHANQGAAQGQLANRLAFLDALLEGLHVGLGDEWSRTVVVVVTEFGRTARVNGTGGTDHGTASAGLLLGGALKPGGIVGDWPTLRQSALFEGRDLAPSLDMRGVFKGVLADHMGVDRTALERTVFPDSAAARPVTGLV